MVRLLSAFVSRSRSWRAEESPLSKKSRGSGAEARTTATKGSWVVPSSAAEQSSSVVGDAVKAEARGWVAQRILPGEISARIRALVVKDARDDCVGSGDCSPVNSEQPGPQQRSSATVQARRQR